MFKKEKQCIHVTIIGSCISRDPFELIKNFDCYRNGEETEFYVDKYIQSISAYSAMSKPLPKEISEKLLQEAQSSSCPNFFKKMIMLDITKDWFNYICEAKSDWLILDFANNRFPLFSYCDTIITSDLAKVVHAKRADKKENDEFAKLCKSERIEPDTFDENFRKQMLSHFVARLVKHFPQNRIIVLNAKSVFSYIDPVTGELSSPNYLVDEDARRVDRHMRFCYEYVSQLLPRAHYVELPATMIGNTRNKWGKYYLHYVDEVLEYIYRAFDLVMTAKLSPKAEKDFLHNLREKYTKTITEKYTALALAAIQRQRSLFSSNEFATPGKYTKNGLNLEIEHDGKFTLTGTATQNTVFYLISHSKNPLGAWKSIEKTTNAGTYSFSTKTGTNNMQCYVQLVLSNDDGEKRWILGNHTNTFHIDHDYKYRLVRIVINEDTTANVSGELILEKLIFKETEQNV